jgi:hypothetical protein
MVTTNQGRRLGSPRLRRLVPLCPDTATSEIDEGPAVEGSSALKAAEGRPIWITPSVAGREHERVTVG